MSKICIVKELLNQDVLYMWSIPFFGTVIVLEMIVSYFVHQHNYSTKDTATNVYFALLNFGLDILMKTFSFLVMGFVYQYSIVTWQVQGIWYWLFAFIGQDFLYYIHHYVDHHSRFFWATHVTHHNSEYFNITTGFRSPVLQPLYRYMFFLPLAFLGVEPLHIMFAYAVNQIYGTLCHTNFIKSKLGLWGLIFVTPSHHRVHHASNLKYLDKNMGMVLIIWDRIFGTFQAEIDEENYEKIHYGLRKEIKDKGPINIIFHEWRDIIHDVFVTKRDLPLGTKLKYVFNPPGWSHDGSTKTSKELQRELDW